MRSNLTEKIKARALESGFCKVGVAPAGALEPEGTRLQEWLARGYQGTMEWMERNAERRSDPREILPGARSVLSVAMNYYTEERHSTEAAAGKISRYAWGDDYHDVLKPKLLELLAYIQTLEPGTEGVVYVDTGPVLEKAWAARAGLGWVAKHTNLITQEFGSWVFLGEIILSVELEYDAPATDHCGTCTLCIEACPTDAIVEPYVLDSNRCISYLTIEHRGEIAKELGEKFDRWIYGCDICQDVCPWNEKFSVHTAAVEFAPRPATIAPQLNHVAEMRQDEFSITFSKSPVKRTKVSGLRRNAAAVLAARKPADEQKEPS